MYYTHFFRRHRDSKCTFTLIPKNCSDDILYTRYISCKITFCGEKQTFYHLWTNFLVMFCISRIDNKNKKFTQKTKKWNLNAFTLIMNFYFKLLFRSYITKNMKFRNLLRNFMVNLKNECFSCFQGLVYHFFFLKFSLQGHCRLNVCWVFYSFETLLGTKNFFSHEFTTVTEYFSRFQETNKF